MINYNAAVYSRLSKEDDKSEQSNSIINQKRIVNQHLSNLSDIRVVCEYSDDGYSGTDFSRPQLLMMLSAIYEGKINCVAVKDLSRLGRDYIKLGKLLETVFLAYGVRLIAVNDGIDTSKGEELCDSILIPVKNLINDSYSADISAKIRSSLQAKRKSGEYTGAFVPYGYIKSEDKKCLIVDQQAAKTVKEIFELCLLGNSAKQTADELNRKGVPSPLTYKLQNAIPCSAAGFCCSKESRWSSTAVLRILKDEVYTGALAQGKRGKQSHRFDKVKVRPESQWIRVNDTHEPIIGKVIFEAAQKSLRIDLKPNRQAAIKFPLAGLVICGECGEKMSRKSVCSGNYRYYNCKKVDNCGAASIKASNLEKIICKVIELYIDISLNSVLQNRSYNAADEKLFLEMNSADEIYKKHSEILSTLYKSLAQGVLDKHEYNQIKAYCSAKIKSSGLEQKKLENQLELNTDIESASLFDRKAMLILVESITVNNINEVEIAFDFSDLFGGVNFNAGKAV